MFVLPLHTMAMNTRQRFSLQGIECPVTIEHTYLVLH